MIQPVRGLTAALTQLGGQRFHRVRRGVPARELVGALQVPGAHHGKVRIGVGVSTRPDARQAAVEATAHARDDLAGEAPSLAVLLGSRSHTDKAADVLDTVQEMVEAPALIGCIAQAIVAGRHEIEEW